MTDIKHGADIHSGDGGYSIGTQEKSEEFAKMRNQSVIDRLKEQALSEIKDSYHIDDFANVFAVLIINACIDRCTDMEYQYWRSWHDQEFTPIDCADAIKQHFGGK